MKKYLFILLALCVFAGCSDGKTTDTGNAGGPTVTQNANGVVGADQWAAQYPDIVASFKANEDNKIVFDHVEEYPMIAAVYEGMAFNTYYNAARSHSYSLEDVQATGRPHALANCLTCKSADYTAVVNKNGVSAYKEEFAAMAATLQTPRMPA